MRRFAPASFAPVAEFLVALVPLLLSFAVAAGLGGCSSPAEGPPAERPVVVALDCETELVAACTFAVGVWGAALEAGGSRLSVVLGTKGDRVYRVSSVEAADGADEACGDDWAGCTDSEGRIRIVRPYWESWGWADPVGVCRSILLHEVGHALGAGHLPEGSAGVMAPGVQVWTCIDVASAARVDGAFASCESGPVNP